MRSFQEMSLEALEAFFDRMALTEVVPTCSPLLYDLRTEKGNYAYGRHQEIVERRRGQWGRARVWRRFAMRFHHYLATHDEEEGEVLA